MVHEEIVDSERTASVSLEPVQTHQVEVASAPAVRLQRLDLARHVAIAPDGKRYVVASFDDRRLGHGFVTIVYPQQNGYLTLVRLQLCEFRFEDPEKAIQQHIKAIEAIQQGRLDNLIKSQPR